MRAVAAARVAVRSSGASGATSSPVEQILVAC